MPKKFVVFSTGKGLKLASEEPKKVLEIQGLTFFGVTSNPEIIRKLIKLLNSPEPQGA